MRTKGFEYRISKGDVHMFISNKVGKDITFTMGTFKGKPMSKEELKDSKEIEITEEQFVQLTERFAFEVDKVIERIERKLPLTSIEFDVAKPSKKAKKK